MTGQSSREPTCCRARTFGDVAVAVWRDLARAIGDHPALVALNVLNEPRPAHPAAVNALYREVVAAIRAERPGLPILLDAPSDADPAGFASLEPIDDPLVLYDVHLYEPWPFITWRVNQGRYAYPSRDAEGRLTDRAHLARALEPVQAWQRRHAVPNNRILLGELGIDRRLQGAATYLADVLSLADSAGWHWPFYAFRDRQTMDYEIGQRPLPGGYWEAEERGEPIAPTRGPNPQWEVIERALRRAPPGGTSPPR